MDNFLRSTATTPNAISGITIQSLPLLNEMDNKTLFLICPETERTIEGLSEKVVLSNGQYLPVIPEFNKGHVGNYLEEKAQEAGLQLSIGMFAIEKCSSGDRGTVPLYCRLNYSK